MAELLKIIGLPIPADSLRKIEEEATIAICGVILFTHLDRDNKNDVLKRLAAIRSKGYSMYYYQLDKLITYQLINKDWVVWSYSNSELQDLISLNNDVSFYAKTFFFGTSPTFATLSNSAWKAFIQGKGVKGTVVDMTKSTHMHDFMTKKLRMKPSVAKVGAAITLLSWFVASGLIVRSNYLLNNAAKEKQKRVVW